MSSHYHHSSPCGLPPFLWGKQASLLCSEFHAIVTFFSTSATQNASPCWKHWGDRRWRWRLCYVVFIVCPWNAVSPSQLRQRIGGKVPLHQLKQEGLQEPYRVQKGINSVVKRPSEPTMHGTDHQLRSLLGPATVTLLWRPMFAQRPVALGDHTGHSARLRERPESPWPSHPWHFPSKARASRLAPSQRANFALILWIRTDRTTSWMRWERPSPRRWLP